MRKCAVLRHLRNSQKESLNLLKWEYGVKIIWKYIVYEKKVAKGWQCGMTRERINRIVSFCFSSTAWNLSQIISYLFYIKEMRRRKLLNISVLATQERNVFTPCLISKTPFPSWKSAIYDTITERASRRDPHFVLIGRHFKRSYREE